MFKVEGLPEGISFQKPGAYGALQIQKIMENKDAISFVILDRDGILANKRKPGFRNDMDDE